jgi:hypothetical protein
MTVSKLQMMQRLISELSKDTSITEIQSKRKGKMVSVGLVNQFALHTVIPNKWFDWERRVGAPIMIIGQDWGPYVSLKKYVDDYELIKDDKGFDYNDYLFKKMSSRTEKFILMAIKETYEKKYKTFDQKIYDKFFFTMAVLFTRQGTKFRGNEFFDEKKSAEMSYPYVARQIEIVQPKVIMTLGNLGFGVVNTYFDLDYTDIKLSSILDSLKSSNGIIQKKGVTIIPNYHPAAHVNPKIMKENWERIWNYINFLSLNEQ